MAHGARHPRHQASVDEVLHRGTISVNAPAIGDQGRPPVVKALSAPAYQSPLRHHRRPDSCTHKVKETLNAHSEYSNSEDDGAAIHRINQYIIDQEIGRGSFGSVHKANDQYGNEFAIKEFSKSRLRKRAQSHLLRKPRNAYGRRLLPSSPQWRGGTNSGSGPDAQASNSLDLIKQEIAIMKKLNHNNLVSLIEVLDDPQEDSLYMVLELCKKGVVMKVSLEEQADAYDDESCRCWFRDMILGIEYLHAQGILHRDIKPDNCLVTDDDVLKIVDFGVSEMFEKHSDMHIVKSAGSPAFMPPELCVARHGSVSGKAADIWSMGVTLYCLRHGRLPFERSNFVELYDAIRDEQFHMAEDCDDNFRDLMRRILEKDPTERITMEDLRQHPWVTKDGTDPLLSAEENTADVIDEPSQAEVDNAITGNMGQLLVVMKAVKRFKKLLVSKRPELMEGIFGRGSRIVQPPLSLHSPTTKSGKTRSVDAHDRRPIESALVVEGVHRDIAIGDNLKRMPEETNSAIIANEDGQNSEIQDDSKVDMSKLHNTTANLLQKEEAAKHHPQFHKTTSNHDDGASSPQQRSGVQSPTSPPPQRRVDSIGRGQAHDPLTDTLFLHVGAGDSNSPDGDSQSHDGKDEHDRVPIVCESPSAVDQTETSIFEQAYQEELAKIVSARGRSATVYLTRRVEGNQDIRDHENVIGHHSPSSETRKAASMGGMLRGAAAAAGGGSGGSGLARLVAKAKEQQQQEAAKSEGTKQETKDGTEADE